MDQTFPGDLEEIELDGRATVSGRMVPEPARQTLNDFDYVLFGIRLWYE